MTKSVAIGFLTAAVCFGLTPPVDASVVATWNAVALNCTQGPPTPPNRPGPAGLLDVALVHAAMHDAAQAVEGRFESYRYSDPTRLGKGTSEAAAAAAAYGVLVGLYQAAAPCLTNVEDPAATYAGDAGLQTGAAAAAALLTHRRPTFTSALDPFVGGTGPGAWRPVAGTTQGANTCMAFTEPFTLLRPSQFRPQPQPPIESAIYTHDYDEVKRLGRATNSERTPQQHDLALFWSPNPIPIIWTGLRDIVTTRQLAVGDAARLMALAAFAAADGQITSFETKYHFNFWRPVTAIELGDFDGNPGTAGEAGWTPLIATPPYPDYASGANNLAAAILTTAQLFFGTDDLEFSISSPVANLQSNPRPYTRLSDAMQDVVEVRILQGIHFRSAEDVGRRQGSRVAQWTFQNFLRPLPGVR